MRVKAVLTRTVYFLAGLLLLFNCAGEASAFTEEQSVRVGMASNIQRQYFEVIGQYAFFDNRGRQVEKPRPGEQWEAIIDGEEVLLYRDGRLVATCRGPVTLSPQGSEVLLLYDNYNLSSSVPLEGLKVLGASGKTQTLSVGTRGLKVQTDRGEQSLKGSLGLSLVTLGEGSSAKKYRGEMLFIPSGGGLTVVNRLPLEEYLYGVVPSEMPATWPSEALKAQAVAARSFALAQMEVTRDNLFDVLTSQLNQVYGGYGSECQAATEAVNDTRGQALLNGTKPVTAFFHSSSGGYTENSQDVWSNPLPYIKTRPDPYDINDKHYNWVVSYDADELIEQLAKKNYRFSSIEDIEILEETSSGARVKRIKITGLGEDGEKLTREIGNADAVRVALGLKSALFEMDKDFEGSRGDKRLAGVSFTGSGWGHGLGMSQFGALNMAEQGYNYQDILKYYYANVAINSLDSVDAGRKW